MIDPKQLRDHVVRPTLQALDMWSPAAEALVLGTAAQESRLTYLHQLGGPALGLWQIERATHQDVWTNYLRPRASLAKRVLDVSMLRTRDASPFEVPDEPLIWNLVYGAAICRLIYRRVKYPLPDAKDWPGLGAYWKASFNTPKGAGTAEQFVASIATIKDAFA